MNPPTRSTRRLLLRAPQPADIDPLFAIQGDPAAMQFTHCASSREATASWVESYAARFTEDGLAPWTAVFVPEDRVNEAFGDLGLSEVGAFVRPENYASVRVLAKAGFQRVRFVPELERDEFRASAPRWRGAARPSAAPDVGDT